MKSFKQYTYIIPKYPTQDAPKTGGEKYENPDAGDWIIGDPTNPIEGWEKNDTDSVLSKADKDITKLRDKTK